MTEQRQDAIRAFEKAAFQGSYGYHDIATLKLVIYELASSHNILNVIVLDADMQALQIEDREEVIPKPNPPIHGANQAQVNEYKIRYEAWKVQSTAINEVKRTILSLLDGQAKKIVEDPVQGTLMRTTTQILTLLMEHYHTMSNEELRAVKTKWQQGRWNQDEDLISFLSSFTDNVTFLREHQYAPPQGEQVTTLLDAIAHVPNLATPTKAAFFQAAPAVAEQTLELLCTHMRTVYRTQYSTTTAASLQSINQAKEAVPDATDVIIQGIAASARATLHGTTVTPTQLEAIQTAVTKAIRQALQPPQPAQDSRTRTQSERRGYRQQQAATTTGERLPRPVDGECPLHRGRQHRWEDCRQNPANKSK